MECSICYDDFSENDVVKHCNGKNIHDVILYILIGIVDFVYIVAHPSG